MPATLTWMLHHSHWQSPSSCSLFFWKLFWLLCCPDNMYKDWSFVYARLFRMSKSAETKMYLNFPNQKCQLMRYYTWLPSFFKIRLNLIFFVQLPAKLMKFNFKAGSANWSSTSNRHTYIDLNELYYEMYIVGYAVKWRCNGFLSKHEAMTTC